MDGIKEMTESFEAASLKRITWDDVTDINFLPKKDVTANNRSHKKGDAKRFLGIKYGTYECDTYGCYDYTLEEFIQSENYCGKRYISKDGKLFRNAVVIITHQPHLVNGIVRDRYYYDTDEEAFKAFKRVQEMCSKAGIQFLDERFIEGKEAHE